MKLSAAVIHLPDAESLLLSLISWFAASLIGLWMFFSIGAGSEIRKNGVVEFYRFLTWRDIESYDWFGAESNMLRLHYRVNNAHRVIVASPLPLTPDQKGAVDKILAEQLQC